MAIRGEPLALYNKHNFYIEIDGVKRGDAATVSGLEAVVSEVAYNPGGSLQQKRPGRVTFADVTITRAHSYDQDFYDWIVQAANGAADGKGLPASQLERTVSIVEMGRAGNEVKRWNLYGTWVKSYKPGDFDGSADSDPLMEEIVLSVHRFEQIAVSVE